jgi:hypothetical protein
VLYHGLILATCNQTDHAGTGVEIANLCDKNRTGIFQRGLREKIKFSGVQNSAACSEAFRGRTAG